MFSARLTLVFMTIGALAGCSDSERLDTLDAGLDDATLSDTTFLLPDGADTPDATPFCGDGSVDEGEECDDGNGDNTDACTNACRRNVTVDVDECAENPDICGGGACHNEDPGYRCECDEGYALNEAGTTCVDLDECAVEPTPCEPGQCINDEPGYHCECPFPYDASGGSCVVCPAQGVLRLTAPAAEECLPVAEDSHQALLDTIGVNVRGLLVGAAESVDFLEDSPFIGQLEEQYGLFQCDQDETDCTPGIPVQSLVDRAVQLADDLDADVLHADQVAASDACSLTLTVPPSLLCTDEAAPPASCSLPEDCGTGWTCANPECVRIACQTNDDCPTDYRCGTGSVCELDCPWLTLPVRVTLWRAGEDDLYGEVAVGDGEDRTRPVDIRVFDDQLAVIADLEQVVRTLWLVARTDGAESPALPDPERVSGTVELDLRETATDVFRLELNLRGVEADAGAHFEWALDQFFESYENQTSLPIAIDVADSCPALFVTSDAAGDLTVGTGLQPLTALVPFAVLNADHTDVPGRCDAGEEECPCYDAEGGVVACPCYDADGMPVDCGNGVSVPCPYASNGDLSACLPNVGSARLDLAGQTVRAALSVGDENEDRVRIDRLALGGGEAMLSRDGFPLDTFETIATLRHNATRALPTSAAVVTLPPDRRGVTIDLASELELDLETHLDTLEDRLINAPEKLNDETLGVLLAGSPANATLRISEGPVRPVEVVAGVLTLFSRYLADTEDPPREPPGTLTVEAGQCLVGTDATADGPTHPFEQIEVSACPTAVGMSADVTADQAGVTNLGQEPTLSLGAGREVFLRADLASVPNSVTSAVLEVYVDSEVGSVSGPVELFQVTSAWSEDQLTWATRPSSAADATSSLSFEAFTDGQGFRRFDVTALVSAWLAAPESDFGVVLRNGGEGYFELVSSESDEVVHRPRLVVK